MTDGIERRIQPRKRQQPLREVETTDYLIDSEVFCSAAPGTVFYTLYDYTIFCREGQSLGDATISAIRDRTFQNLIQREHNSLCRKPYPANHSISMRVIVKEKPAPPGFKPEFLVFEGR